MNVLVVDDDRQWAHVLAAMVMESADSVRVAHDLHGCRSAVSQLAPDLLLLDLMLPDALPQTTLDAIPELKFRGVGRVAVVTGSHLNQRLTARILAAGADQAVSKNCRTLERAIADLLAGKHVLAGR